MEITLLFSTVTLSNCDLYICKAEKGNIVTSTSIHLNVRGKSVKILRLIHPYFRTIESCVACTKIKL